LVRSNAGGRLTGTVLSGALYQWQGLEACLWASACLLVGASALSLLLPREVTSAAQVATKAR
jgi:predicted MFS family arabinose efflux permease